MRGKGTNDEWISSISWKVNNDGNIFYPLQIWSDDQWVKWWRMNFKSLYMKDELQSLGDEIKEWKN